MLAGKFPAGARALKSRFAQNNLRLIWFLARTLGQPPESLTIRRPRVPLPGIRQRPRRLNRRGIRSKRNDLIEGQQNRIKRQRTKNETSRTKTKKASPSRRSRNSRSPLKACINSFVIHYEIKTEMVEAYAPSEIKLARISLEHTQKNSTSARKRAESEDSALKI